MAIEIKADPTEKIDVVLVGKPYQITPPKAALAMRLAVEAKMADDDPEKMMTAMDMWVVKAFGETKAKAIRKRLDDPQDQLDIPHIVQLMQAVIEAQTGDPTT